jgi:hypothetical protein
VFGQFDKDGSGTIEKTELIAVCEEMGLEMGHSDIKNMMEELDSDKNGVIDKQEFQLWWMSGRKGPTGTFSKVLANKLGGQPFFMTLNAVGKTLAKKARSGQYKHIT